MIRHAGTSEHGQAGGACPTDERIEYGCEREAALRTPAAAARLCAETARIRPGMVRQDEEKFLPRCLQSVAGVVDEINIVDTGSTDGTIEIARSFGARVERREWRDDFAWARNEALALATKRWILVLDADEELNADSRDLVAALKTVPAHLTGVWVRCLNLADDYKGTGACSHALGRIFPNSPRIRYRSPI